MYIEKKYHMLHKPQKYSWLIWRKKVGGTLSPENPSDIYDAAERQFLLQIPRARVHRDGKNCRVSMEEAQILFRHRLWQSRDAECSLFSNYIALGTGMYDTVGCTNWQVVARGRGRGLRREATHIRNDGIIKARNPGDDENVNFDSRGPSGRVSVLGDSLPIEDAFYIPLYRSFVINWAVKNRRDPAIERIPREPLLFLLFPPNLFQDYCRDCCCSN